LILSLDVLAYFGRATNRTASRVGWLWELGEVCRWSLFLGA
jgi:hypothetical protein